MIHKTLIVGRHNPLSTHAEDALAPFPVNSSGHRLYEMLHDVRPDITQEIYMESFARRNLWRGKEWPTGRGATLALRQEGGIILETCVMYTSVILLGMKVWDSILDCKPPEYFHNKRIGATLFWYVPHPSGLNFIYNQPRNRQRAGQLLASLLPMPLRLEVVR